MTNEQITKWAVEVGMNPVMEWAVEVGLNPMMEWGYTRFASPAQLQAFAQLVRNATLAEPAVEPFGYVSEHNCAEPYKFQFHTRFTGIYPDNCVSVTPVFTSPPPPAEPAVEPVRKGLFVDLIAQHPGLAEELAAIVIDAPPAESAPVPLLSDEEVGMLTVYGGLHHVDVPLLAEFVRHIETTVRRKAGL